MAGPPDPRPSNPPEDEIEAAVFDALLLDKVGQWRYDNLLAAGYTESQCLMLAINRTIDLHKAVDLARKAGPDRAYKIIS